MSSLIVKYENIEKASGLLVAFNMPNN